MPISKILNSVVEAIHLHIHMTNCWRNTNNQKELRLSTIRSHQKVKIFTLAVLLKIFLWLAGIDTAFNAHSINGTATVRVIQH